MHFVTTLLIIVIIVIIIIIAMTQNVVTEGDHSLTKCFPTLASSYVELKSAIFVYSNFYETT